MYIYIHIRCILYYNQHRSPSQQMPVYNTININHPNIACASFFIHCDRIACIHTRASIDIECRPAHDTRAGAACAKN